MRGISLDDVKRLVLRKQHLTDDPRIDDVIQIVRDIGGLHATSSVGPYLSLFARTRDFVKESLDEELYVKRSLGKIRCMRKTLYILTNDMIPIAYAATRKMNEEITKRYAEFRGVSSERYEEFSRSILEILKNREMTASEIKKTLRTQLDVSAILYLMCDQGLLTRSRAEKGWKDKNLRYAIFTEYFPDVDLTKIDESEAVTLLVLQYLSSFGPATEKDIIWWTGLNRTIIREALNSIQKQIGTIEVSDLKGGFILLNSDENLMKGKEKSKKQVVNPLPGLDPYLMGYKERERYLDYKNYGMVFDRSGNATSTISLDSRVIGVWDFIEEEEPLVKLFFFEEVEEAALTEMSSKARNIGKFIVGREVQIKECDSMVPLTRRRAGGVMSPLKDS